MRVLVVEESPERAQLLRDGLRKAGCEVVSPSSPLTLSAIEEHRPDIIIIGAESPGRDVLEQLVATSQHAPRPAVMDPERIKPILDTAVARFEELQALRAQLADANLRLAERKLVERAKGLLMKSRGLDEEAAYALLRRFAMDRKLRLAELAQQLIDTADLLNGA